MRAEAVRRGSRYAFVALPAVLALVAASCRRETPRAVVTDDFRVLTLADFRGFKAESLPAGWRLENGVLTRAAPGRDIITRDQFANFDLRFDWMVAPGGNSGVMYRVTEALEETWHSGPEYQVLDDSGHADGRSRLTSAASVYGLYASPAGLVRPAGQWNEGRILVDGARVEHWLNGVKVVDYELGTADWDDRVRRSKFRAWPPFGRAERGHIALQDHGDRVAYRNLRIKVLP